MTAGPWKITTNVINGETRYGVYRTLGNPGEPDHSGNREVFDYFKTRKEAEKVAAEFNQIVEDKQDFENEFNAEFNPKNDILKHFPVPDELREGTQVSIEMISENPYNPRKRFDEEKLQELAESFKEVGIIQPLVVTGGLDGYTLIAGERRLKAAKMAGLKEVPVVYRDFGVREWVPLMLIENLQREDLDPIEEANAFKVLTQEHGWKQTELAEKLGISQSHIANRIRLLVLPESVQEGISQGTVTTTEGKELATYAKVPGVAEVLDEAMADNDTDNLLWTAKHNAYDSVRPLHEGGRPEPQFDTAKCVGCKEKIMMPGRWGNDRDKRLPWCTNIRCWSEKQETALHVIAERAKQQAIDAGEEMLQLDDLPGDAYESLDVARFATVECAQCEHRRHGRYGWMDDGDELIDICLNPECYNTKKTVFEKAERQREKEARDAHKERKENLIAGFFPQALLDVGPDKDGPDFKALVYMTAQTINGMDEEDAICERYGWNVLDDVDMGWREQMRHIVKQLATLTTSELLRVIFFVTLGSVSHTDVVFKAVYGEGDSDGND